MRCIYPDRLCWNAGYVSIIKIDLCMSHTFMLKVMDDKLANCQVWGCFNDAMPACWADLPLQWNFEVFQTPPLLSSPVRHACCHPPYNQLVVICHGPGTVVCAYDITYVYMWGMFTQYLLGMYVWSVTAQDYISVYMCIYIYLMRLFGPLLCRAVYVISMTEKKCCDWG